MHKSNFAQCADSVIISPISVLNPKNIFLGNNIGIGPQAHISALNAKFICNGNCSMAEGLTVHIGNHTRVVSKFVTDITEANKPEGYDHDVIVEQDCLDRFKCHLAFWRNYRQRDNCSSRSCRIEVDTSVLYLRWSAC